MKTHTYELKLTDLHTPHNLHKNKMNATQLNAKKIFGGTATIVPAVKNKRKENENGAPHPEDLI